MSFQLLIVDDEVPIRKALASYIPWEEYNCTVYDTASNGKEAIKKLEAHPVDLVITDVKMPLIDGIELSKYIYDNYPDTLVIILSGYAEFEYAQSAMRYHVSEYLLKPVSKDNLIAAVQNTLKQKKSVTVASKKCGIRRHEIQYFCETGNDSDPGTPDRRPFSGMDCGTCTQ